MSELCVCAFNIFVPRHQLVIPVSFHLIFPACDAGKRISWAKMSQYSIHLMWEVWASFVTTLTSRVVTVSTLLKSIVITVLKKFGSLKNEAE